MVLSAAVWHRLSQALLYDKALRPDHPQTVLKTAGLASAAIHYRAPEIEDPAYESVSVRQRSVPVVTLAVFLAVIGDTPGDS